MIGHYRKVPTASCRAFSTLHPRSRVSAIKEIPPDKIIKTSSNVNGLYTGKKKVTVNEKSSKIYGAQYRTIYLLDKSLLQLNRKLNYCEFLLLSHLFT